MTPQEEKETYRKAYAAAKKQKHNFYSCRPKLPLPGRLELEEALENMVNVLKKYGVCWNDGDEPMAGITSFLITHYKEDASPYPFSFNISKPSSCWLTVQLEPTQEELESQWRKEAEWAVEKARMEEKEREAIENKRLEDLRRQQENDARVRRINEATRNRDKEMRDFVEHVDAVVHGMLKRTNGWFAEDHCNEVQLKALKKYVDACRVFSDAMNMGLSGLGLYSQNEARTEAHEALLDAFYANNERARRVTKDIDFVDTWDPISGKYEHLDEDRSIDALAWALLECQEKI